VEVCEGWGSVQEAELGAGEERGETGFGRVEVLVVAEDEVGEGGGLVGVGEASVGC
jgi:hypothetical protein